MVKSGQLWSGLVVCKDSTGALATPSVGPAGALYVDGIANVASVTVSGSNPYKWTVTLPALTAGQCVSMYITATIANIATASVVAEDVADTKRVSDLNDAAAAPNVGAIGTEIWAGTYTRQINSVSGSIGGDVAGKVLGGGEGTISGVGTSANVTYLAGLSVPVDNLVLALGTGGLVEKLNSMLEAAGLAYRFTAAALAEAPTEAGIGAITFTYTLTSSVNASPIADADVWVTTDSAGSNVIAVGRTNAAGQVVFYLDAGTVYVWRQKTGWTFANPDTEVVA